MAPITAVEDMLPGHVVRDSYVHTVRAVCGPLAIPVTSSGTRFYMVGFFPWRLVANHLGDPLTAANIGDWIDGAKHGKPCIRIAETPDQLPMQMFRALVGGGYHESWHRKYTCQTRPSTAEVIRRLQPYMAKADWKPYRKIVLDLSNIIEDILIERVGNAEFPGAYQKMCDLQDFILSQEARGRTEGLKAVKSGRTIPVANVAMSVFRDIGLGYQTLSGVAAMAEYRELSPEAVAMVETGPLRPLLDQCIPTLRTPAEINAAIEYIQSGISLFLAMDFVLILLGQNALQAPPPSNQPGQSGESDDPGEGDGQSNPGQSKSGKNKPGKGKGESGEGGGKPSEKTDSKGKGGSKSEASSDEGDSTDGDSGGGDSDDGEESENGGGSGDKPGESPDGSSDGESGEGASGWKPGQKGSDSSNTSSQSQSKGNPGGKAGGNGPSDDSKTLANILADALRNGFGLVDSNSAFSAAVKAANKEAAKGMVRGEAPYRPLSTTKDTISLVYGTGSSLPGAYATVAGEARAASTTVRSQLRNLFFGLEAGGREHGLPRGPIFSERNLVETVACVRSGSIPNRAFAVEDEHVDLSLACTIIVDESGSMDRKLISTGGVLYALATAMEQIGAQQMIAGFRNSDHNILDTDPNDVSGTHRQGAIHYDVFLRWGERFSGNVARLANLRATGGTPMADGIELGLRELRRRKETHRVMFVLTDGEPDHSHRPVVVGQIRKATEEGILMVGVGLGKDSFSVTKLFPHHVHRDRISEIPAPLIALLRVLVRTIKAKNRGTR